jgi:AraC family transcriptional regulator
MTQWFGECIPNCRMLPVLFDIRQSPFMQCIRRKKDFRNVQLRRIRCSSATQVTGLCALARAKIKNKPGNAYRGKIAMFEVKKQNLMTLIPSATLQTVAAQMHGEEAGEISLPSAISLKDRTLALLLDIVRKASRATFDKAALEYLKKAAAARIVRTQASTTGLEPDVWGSTHFSLQQMQQISNHIQANLSGDIHIEGIARQVGLSRAQFARRFKVTTGMTPHKFVMNARVRNAMALLADGDLSLAEIAARAGFANPPHFAALFQRMVKVSPSAYRRQLSPDKACVQMQKVQAETRDLSCDPVRAMAVDGSLPNLAEFQLEQTSLPVNDKVRLIKSSQGLGWTDLFAAVTDELPHEGLRGVVPAVWVVTAASPNDVQRIGSTGKHSAILPQYAISITGAGDAVYDEIAFPLKARHLYLRQSLIDDVAKEVFKDGHERRFIGSSFGLDDAVLYRLITSIRNLMEEPAFGSRLEVDYLTQTLAAYLLTKHSNAGPTLRALPAHVFNSRQINALGDYINENLSVNMGISDLAGVVGLGRSQFIRRFKATALMTPHQFVTLRRVSHARKLLTKSGIDYARIAVDCGFADQSHFIAMFKRAVGTTPHTYRRLVAQARPNSRR